MTLPCRLLGRKTGIAAILRRFVPEMFDAGNFTRSAEAKMSHDPDGSDTLGSTPDGLPTT